MTPTMTSLARLGPESDLLRVCQDALARVSWIREEYDPLMREQALEDLELDLAAVVDHHSDLRRAA